MTTGGVGEKSKGHHYVPQWHLRRFAADGPPSRRLALLEVVGLVSVHGHQERGRDHALLLRPRRRP